MTLLTVVLPSFSDEPGCNRYVYHTANSPAIQTAGKQSSQAIRQPASQSASKPACKPTNQEEIDFFSSPALFIECLTEDKIYQIYIDTRSQLNIQTRQGRPC